VHTRKLLKTGNSIAVSLDPDLLQEILPGAEPGTAVKVGRQGDRIVIGPA
jgi:antitoxin component of MazEF toxin-antitoxin module